LGLPQNPSAKTFDIAPRQRVGFLALLKKQADMLELAEDRIQRWGFLDLGNSVSVSFQSLNFVLQAFKNATASGVDSA